MLLNGMSDAVSMVGVQVRVLEGQQQQVTTGQSSASSAATPLGNWSFTLSSLQLLRLLLSLYLMVAVNVLND